MHGTIDGMLTVVHGHLLRREIGGEVKWKAWDGVGHVIMWEREQEFNKDVADFVNECQQLKS